MIESVILDLDGTLIDSAPGILESLHKAICDVLPQQVFDPSKVRVGPPIREMARKAFPDLATETIEQVAVAFRKHYDSVGWRKMTVYDGALSALRSLSDAGYALFLATNKPLGPTRTILQDEKMVSYLRDYVAIDSVKPPFADKAHMLLHLCKTHKLNPHGTAYVGDTKADSEAAVRCGMPFVFAAFGYGRVTEIDANAIWKKVGSLDELTPSLLRGS